ncbi:unnamed protein product [Gordionus sp. m RMFG-2023]
MSLTANSSPGVTHNVALSKRFVTHRVASVPMVSDISTLTRTKYIKAKTRYPILIGLPFNATENVIKIFLKSFVKPIFKKIFLDSTGEKFDKNGFLGSSADYLNSFAMSKMNLLEKEIPLLFEPSDKVLEGLRPIYTITIKPFVLLTMFAINVILSIMNGTFSTANKGKEKAKAQLGEAFDTYLDGLDYFFFNTPPGRYFVKILYLFSNTYLPTSPKQSSTPTSGISNKIHVNENAVINNFFDTVKPDKLEEKGQEKLDIKLGNKKRVLRPYPINPAAPNISSESESVLKKIMNASASFNERKKSPRAKLENLVLEVDSVQPKPIDSVLYLILTLKNRLNFVFVKALRLVDKKTGLISFSKLFNKNWEVFKTDLRAKISRSPQDVEDYFWNLTKFSSEIKFPGFSYFLLSIHSRTYLACERLFSRYILFLGYLALAILPTTWSASFILLQERALILRQQVSDKRGGFFVKLETATKGLMRLLLLTFTAPIPEQNGSNNTGNAARFRAITGLGTESLADKVA